MVVDIDEKIEEDQSPEATGPENPGLAGAVHRRDHESKGAGQARAPRRGAGDRGEAIRKERIRQGLTHKELGAKAGLSNVIVSRAETGTGRQATTP